jgi:hypothetical protein
LGEWDLKLLAEFDESFLSGVGFSSEELDEVFDIDPTPEEFDLEKELQKLKIHQIQFKKGDIDSFWSSYSAGVNYHRR